LISTSAARGAPAPAHAWRKIAAYSRFEEGKVVGIRDHAVLDRFGEAAGELHARERGRAARVGDDDARLVEGAQQILAGGQRRHPSCRRWMNRSSRVSDVGTCTSGTPRR